MKRLWRFLGTILLAWGAFAGDAAGQPREPPVTRPRLDVSPPGGMPFGGTIQPSSRPFYLQGAVVVLLSAAAVWTVCHETRRS